MSEHYPAEICIGGNVARSKIAGLIAAINNQGCSSEWDGPVINLGNPEEDIGKCIEKIVQLRASISNGCAPANEGLLFLYDSEARWGEFQEIETYCEANGIAFNRYSDGYCEYDPEIKVFREGMEAPVAYNTDSNGQPQISADKIIPLLVIIEEMGQANTGEVWGLYEQLAAAAEVIKGDMPRDVPPLESFEIVEG